MRLIWTAVAIVCFLNSCNNIKNDKPDTNIEITQMAENVTITNARLMLDLKSFITQVKNQKPCNEKYITIVVRGNKLYITNSKPMIPPSFIGIMLLDNTIVYFISDSDHPELFTYEKKMTIDPYDNIIRYPNCEPPIDNIFSLERYYKK